MFLAQLGEDPLGGLADGLAASDLRHPACELSVPGNFRVEVGARVIERVDEVIGKSCPV